MTHILLTKTTRMKKYWFITFVYFNDVLPPLQFRVTTDTLLVDLKSRMQNNLHYSDNRRVIKIEYYSPSLYNTWKMKFRKFELKMNEDLRIVWSTFHCYATKDPIEVNVTLARSTDDILKMLKCPQPSLNDEM